MFGYIRPNRSELKVRELEAYQAAYCGLCHTIGQRHGLVARMFLSYDIVFLAMLLETPESQVQIEKKRCPARLWCRKKNSACGMAGLASAADAGTILSYWKLQDSISDGSPLEKVLSRFLSLLLHRGYRKAFAAMPEFAQQVERCLDELHQLERAHAPSLDQPADTFARILEAAVPPDTDEEKRRILSHLLYHVGRWIYLIDAWDDMEEDQKSGNYNPILSRFPDFRDEDLAVLRTTLHHSQKIAISDWNLVDGNPWNGVIENILYYGMTLVEELVATGQWKNIKNKHGRTNR